MPTPRVDELQDAARFELIERIPHRDIARTVRLHLKRRSVVTLGYWALNFVVLAWLALVWHNTAVGLLAGFPAVCLSMVGGIVLLMPIHEGLHALAYRLASATEVRIQFEWGRLTAHCVDDRAVVGRTAFAGICLTPLAGLNLLLWAAGAFIELPATAQLLLAGALLLHTGAASGDVALVNLIWRERDRRELWTYDDVTAGESYIYGPRRVTIQPA